MKEIIIRVYHYDELNEDAQAKAREEFNDIDYSWEEDNRKTLERFCEVFPVKVKKYEYGYGGKYVSWLFNNDVTDEQGELSGKRLISFIWNNYGSSLLTNKTYYFPRPQPGSKERTSRIIKYNSCPLTGYYMDEEILSPVYEVLAGKRMNQTFEEVIDACLESWLNACEEDFENYYSEEGIKEIILSNDYEFTEEGRLWKWDGILYDSMGIKSKIK